MIRWVLVMVEVEQYMLAGLLGVKAMYQIACDQSVCSNQGTVLPGSVSPPLSPENRCLEVGGGVAECS